MSFSDQLRAARLAKGYTQEQLAKIIGVAKSTLTGYEKGNREPDVLKIHALAKALGVTGDELLDLGSPNAIIVAQNDEEILLLKTYRSLNTDGQQYIQQSLKMAQATYAASDFEARRAVHEQSKENTAYEELDSEVSIFPTPYVARDGSTGEMLNTKDAQEEALRALDKFSDPDL